jgi:hypothetical protein
VQHTPGRRVARRLEYETALTLITLGRPADALSLLSRANASARQRGNTTLIRASSVARIVALSDIGWSEQARSMVSETEPLYARLRASQQYTARLFLFARAHVALASGDVATAHSAIAEARALLGRLQNATDPARRLVHFYEARLAWQQHRHAEALHSADAALRLSRQQAIDADASLFVGLVIRAQSSAALGDTDGARKDARLALAHFAAVASRDQFSTT